MESKERLDTGWQPYWTQLSVGVEGRLSPTAHVMSGVPQCTVSGPSLFLIHLIGISTNNPAGTSVTSFDDDTRLLRGTHEEHCCELLQDDLKHIYNWAQEIGKFELVRFWLDHDLAQDIL